jgi:ACR3 family arsenite efflux pump ArsB
MVSQGWQRLVASLRAGRFLAAALVVVTQPLVEAVGMVIYVRAVPYLLPARPRG